jgi:chemotaxis protein histidine kinase CheA
MMNQADPALLEMFRAELEAHMTVLNDGLLALERDPGQSHLFEALMRAAHSIKGAAKIVGLSAVVEIAHAIEDCFLVAREGRLQLSSQLVDDLFESVDLLGQVAQADDPEGIQDAVSQVRTIVKKLRAERNGTATEPTTASVFHPRGNLDTAWVIDHHREIAASMRQTGNQITFDLSDTHTVDPVGLALLHLVTKASSEATSWQHMGVRIKGASAPVFRLLEATGLVRPTAER